MDALQGVDRVVGERLLENGWQSSVHGPQLL